jgi:O-antigen ligase
MEGQPNRQAEKDEKDEKEEEEEEEPNPLSKRVVGTGLFRDPNDLCVLLVASMILAFYRLTDRSASLARLLWLLPLALFAYGFTRTQSRGGLLALMAGMGVMVYLRYGWARLVLIGAVAVPVLGAVLGARQMELSANTETGQERIQLWSMALTLLKQHPIFGVGMHHFTDHESHVAHNSFLHAFAELGLVGGTVFLSAAFLALWSLYKLTLTPPALPGRPSPPPREITDPVLRGMFPFLAGAVATWASGMMTLTLTYVMPTYTLLGLTVAFLSLATTNPPTRPERLDARLLVRLGLVTVLFLLSMQVFVRATFRG